MSTDSERYAIDIVELENQKLKNQYMVSSLTPLERQNLESKVSDSPEIFEINGVMPEDDAILIVSNKRFPNFVRETVEKARAVSQILNARLNTPVLLPLAWGSYDERSYAFWPRHQQISGNRIVRRIQLTMLRGEIMNWLQNVAIRSAVPVQSGPNLENQYQEPLTFLRNKDYVPEKIKDIAGTTLELLDLNRFRPSSILQHGDFWYGNILLEKNWPFPLQSLRTFYVIDWGGAILHGYPYVDILRYLMSTGRNNTMSRDLAKYANQSGLPLNDILSYICAYVGHLGMNRNEFPLDRYLKLADNLISMALEVSARFSVSSRLQRQG